MKIPDPILRNEHRHRFLGHELSVFINLVCISLRQWTPLFRPKKFHQVWHKHSFPPTAWIISLSFEGNFIKLLTVGPPMGTFGDSLYRSFKLTYGFSDTIWNWFYFYE